MALSSLGHTHPPPRVHHPASLNILQGDVQLGGYLEQPVGSLGLAGLGFVGGLPGQGALALEHGREVADQPLLLL